MNFLVVIILVAIDQLTKYLAYTRLSKLGSIPIIEDIFHLTYVENRGAAFGMLQNKKWFFVVITIAVVAFIIKFISDNKQLDKPVVFALDLIIAGAIGNLIDRVRLSFVVDFFDFIIWPVFNVADICVVVGGVLLSYYILFKNEQLFD